MADPTHCSERSYHTDNVTHAKCLERRVRVDQKLLEVALQTISLVTNFSSESKTYLEPSSCLRCRLECIIVSAVRIVSRRTGVRGTITLTTGLDPDERVDESVTGVGGRTNTEASADNIAPVTPSLLLGRLDTVAACSCHIRHMTYRSEGGYIPVSTTKWALKPRLCSNGPKALM